MDTPEHGALKRYLFDIERVSYGTIVIKADKRPTDEEVRQAIVDTMVNVEPKDDDDPITNETYSNVDWCKHEYTKVDLGAEYDPFSQDSQCNTCQADAVTCGCVRIPGNKCAAYNPQ